MYSCINIMFSFPSLLARYLTALQSNKVTPVLVSQQNLKREQYIEERNKEWWREKGGTKRGKCMGYMDICIQHLTLLIVLPLFPTEKFETERKTQSPWVRTRQSCTHLEVHSWLDYGHIDKTKIFIVFNSMFLMVLIKNIKCGFFVETYKQMKTIGR